MTEVIEKTLLNMGEPHNKQKEVLVAPQKRILLNWGRRSGKSFLAGMKVAMSAIEVQVN